MGVTSYLLSGMILQVGVHPCLSPDKLTTIVTWLYKPMMGSTCFSWPWMGELFFLFLPNFPVQTDDDLEMTLSHRIHGTGIFTSIYHKNQLNLGKYIIHGCYGFLFCHFNKRAKTKAQPTGLAPCFFGHPVAICWLQRWEIRDQC